MNIWLIKTGEPIPTDGEKVRMMRMGILAETLVSSGHKVLWWNANFNHSSKKFRNLPENRHQVNHLLEIKLLDSPGYTKNVSFQRLFVDHPKLASNFSKGATLVTDRPDVIVSAFPTPGLCAEAIKYGKENDIPVIIDLRDLWPDAFLDPFPTFIKPIVKTILFPLYNKTKHILSNAAALTGISEPFLEWGLKLAGRKKNKFDTVFPFGYKKANIENDSIELNAFPFLKTQPGEKSFTFCYIGNLSYNLNMQPIYDALEALKDQEIKFKFIICGRGVAMEDFEKLFKSFDNVFFTGFINANQIASIMKYSDIGIVPYVDTPNFQNTISNKVIEYLAGGLPILTSIDGYMGPYLTAQKVGLVYKDKKQLSTHLLNLSNDKELLLSMKAKSLELFQNNFKAEEVYKSFVSLIEKIGNINLNYHNNGNRKIKGSHIKG